MGLHISAVIITYNEERNIERCLHSLRDVADEILVVDSLSADRTKIVCERYGARFIPEPFRGYRDQKNFAMASATYDFILSLDADEALTTKLKKEILSIKQKGANADAYAVNRLNNFCGTFVRHGSWYPDRKIRLWDRRKGCWKGGSIHERVEMDHGAKVRRIPGDLLHYTYTTLSDQVKQQSKFSDIASWELFAQRKKTNVFLDLMLYPVFVFAKSYFLRLGFLDGYTGVLVAVSVSYYRFLKYAKLRILWKTRSHG